MKCTILHEGKGRMRVHVEKVRMTLHRADVLEAYLNHHDAIVHAAVYERTGDVVITYTGRRSAAIAVLAGYKFDVAEYDALVTSADSRRLNREYQDKMFDLVAGRCLRKLFLPAPLDAAYTAFRSIRFLWKGVRCVLSRRLEVEVLDALSIGVSLLRGDFGTAGSVMFLLNLGSLLEEWTRKKSLDDLARSMALNVDKVWVRSQGTEVLVPLTKVRSGDEVVVRSGNMIPLDGTVLEGEAMVNQAALTGEAMSGNGGNERVLMPQILDGLPVLAPVAGGATRAASVRAGLDALERKYPSAGVLDGQQLGLRAGLLCAGHNWLLDTSLRLATDRPLQADRPGAPWSLNMIVHSSYDRFDAELALVQEFQPKIVSTALGSPRRVLDVVHGYGGIVMADVINPTLARKAADAGARSGLTPATKDRRDREIEQLRTRAEKAEAELTKTRAALDLVGKAHALLETLSESADTGKPHGTR